MLDVGGVKNVSFDFIMTVLSDCKISQIDTRTIAPMLHKVTLAAAILDIAFTDTIGTLHSDQTYCGVKTYALSYTPTPPALSPSLTFLTNVGSILTLWTSFMADVGFHPITVTVGLQDFPMVPT